jgi:antirestriction protein ArdC
MTVMEKLTASIIEKLEEGVVPWSQPWIGGTAGKNIITNKEYRGFNWFLTLFSGFASPYWMTFKQAQKLGGTVKKGSKGLPIYYFNFTDINPEGDEEKLIPFVRYYHIFNLDQVEIDTANLPLYAQKPVVKFNWTEADKIMKGEEIIEGYATCPRIEHNENRAYYRPATDTINMPMLDMFKRPVDYYATLFHEMVHSTGAAHRLNRKAITGTQGFRSRSYGMEELVAEMGAARLCYEAHIENEVIDQNAAYISNWLSAIKESPKLLYTSANAADAAARYILGVTD